jgi:V/A-type H+/Na+-transporting ATPase subunit E
MPGIGSIQAKILEEAGNQAQKSLVQARSEADDILRAAAAEAEQKRNEILQKASRDVEERKKRFVSVAELEARKQKLGAKQIVISEAFEKALERLNSLSDTEYQTILIHLISESIQTGNEEVVLSERDQKRVSPDFINILNEYAVGKGIRPAALKLASKPGNIRGGFVLRLGDIEMNHSFEVSIRVKREQMESEIVKILFQ